MELFAWVFFGTLVGAALGLVALVFFEDEIFNCIEAAVDKVRRLLGLS